MAQEITVNVRLGASKGGGSVAGSVNLVQDMAGNNYIAAVQNIATAATAIDLGDVASPPSYVFIQNLDPDNFVLVDASDEFDGFPQKILPGRCVLLSPETVTLYAKADTAAVNINVVALDH